MKYSSFPISGESVCNYAEGSIAGTLEVYRDHQFNVKEIDCLAIGGRTYRFSVGLKYIDFRDRGDGGWKIKVKKSL